MIINIIIKFFYSSFQKHFGSSFPQGATCSQKGYRKENTSLSLLDFHISDHGVQVWELELPIQAQGTIIQLNEQITQNLHQELISKLSEPCKSSAEALLCKYAFPDCTLKEGVAVGLPLCQEDCMALRNHYCFKDWALIEDNKRRNSFVKTRGHFRLPKCELLPTHNNSTKTCTKSSITTMRWDLATSKLKKTELEFSTGVHKTAENANLQD